MNSSLSQNPLEQIKALRDEIDIVIGEFLDHAGNYLISIGPELEPVASQMRTFLLDGGKRFRPLLGAMGAIAVNGEAPSPQIIKAVSSLELLHACALIHDDLMDGSDTRRAKPSMHRQFEGMHRKANLAGVSENYGQASAILLGDLALIWSDQILHQAGLSQGDLMRVLPIFDELRVELMAGQYLDVYEQSLATQDAKRSLKVASYKSGKYSIERPLHFGATIRSGSAELIRDLSRFGIPIGEAFQLRDDLLGVFGDPEETGKPAGDDLREGKRTVLIALAIQGSDQSAVAELSQIGNPELDANQITRLREVIFSSGAVAKVEEMISERALQASQALSSELIAPEAKGLLEQMAQMALVRKS